MKRKAFTFWQITLILASIVILGAMLFPVFFRARESGRPRDYCQSNLKQLALGLKQYVQDYDEKYPPASTDWPEVAQPYLKSWQIFQCPLDNNGSAQQTTDYFFNARLLGAEERKIIEPNLTILAGDGQSDQKSATLPQLPASWTTDTNSPAWRHRKGANYAFADGHVKRLTPDKITLDKPSANKPTFLLGRSQP